MRTTHVIIKGMVQGVCFRDYARRQAFTLGLTGWVRNMSNGSVEAMLCGRTEKIDNMLQWLKQGSPRSQVDDLHISEIASGEQFTTFEIRF